MKTRILMVCLGNICRSPLAEGILRSKISPEKAEIDSAGTAGYHIGETPDQRSVAIARKNNIDISSLRGRKFGVSDFDRFDHIYVMDRSNYDNVIEMARHEGDREKVALILNLSNPGSNTEVPDPYYGGAEGFSDVYRMLDKACDVLAASIG
ncbi:low molecular weight protein-tyrosine-phosphatase [Sinomicrobium soli]|uniref:low molecular weight protein-tyrosine-phosphatase n=1 Tax=Sinomicrobium sp. N-1-3-6 TaxID=2219864 RepID=UPI000DCF2DAF|nr:low molecular weight protein-tyrosine-phosphatase [Sinomicrobium sp. N-1-3-6]RAV29979.1 low molecular weight phosphotyrosine protein phosphatase [Sinomicrobium sp. N-1-3-6]